MDSANSPEPPPLQKIQPFDPSVPSRLGQVMPAVQRELIDFMAIDAFHFIIEGMIRFFVPVHEESSKLS